MHTREKEEEGEEKEEVEEEREGKEGPVECVWVAACGPLIAHGPFMDPRIRERKSSSVCSFVYTPRRAHDAPICGSRRAGVCRYARCLICTERGARVLFRISDPDPAVKISRGPPGRSG